MKSSTLLILLISFISCENFDNPTAIKLISKGEHFLDVKNYTSANIAFKDAMKYELSELKKASNNRNISICFEHLNQKDSALYYSKLSFDNLKPNTYFYQNNKAEYLLLKGEINQAEKMLLNTVKLFPEEKEVHQNLALIYSGTFDDAHFDVKKALQYSEKAYQLKKSTLNKEQLAIVYFQIENFQKASDLFQSLAEKFPETKLYQFNQGQCLYFLGKEQQGYELMRSAAERDDHCRELFNELIQE